MATIIETDYSNGFKILEKNIKLWVEKCEKDVKNGKPVSNISCGNSSVVSFSYDNGKTITTIITKNFKERTIII